MSAPGGGYQPPNYGGSSGHGTGGFGGTGGYQGLGYYGTPPEPPKKKRNLLLVSLVVAAVLVVGAVATVIVLNNDDGDNPQATGQTTSSQPSTTTRPTGTTTTPSKPVGDPLSPKATGAPQVPGWKVIAIDDGKQLRTSKAYDVPPAWAALDGAPIFGEGAEKVQLFTTAIYMRGYCPSAPNSFRGMAGLATDKERDGAKAATAVAQRLAGLVFATSAGKPKVEPVGQPLPVTIDRDKKAFLTTAKATVTAGPQDKCAPPTGLVTVVAIPPKPEETESIILAAFADQGFPEATTADDLQKIVTSMHAAN